MVEILVYTTEEARAQLSRFRKTNEKAFAELEQHEGDISARLRLQRYSFVAELAAFVEDGPGKFYYESRVFPFLGFTDCYNDLPGLVQGIKEAIRLQTPKNIETVLYTVENHDAENQVRRRDAEELLSEPVENPSLGESVELSKEEWDECLQELVTLAGAETRGLNEEERKEFVRLYG